MTANKLLLVKQGINEEDEIKINDLHQIRYDLHLVYITWMCTNTIILHEKL